VKSSVDQNGDFEQDVETNVFRAAHSKDVPDSGVLNRLETLGREILWKSDQHQHAVTVVQPTENKCSDQRPKHNTISCDFAGFFNNILILEISG